jgi:hypothetical protein
MKTIPKQQNIQAFKNASNKSKNSHVKLSSTKSVSELKGKSIYIPQRSNSMLSEEIKEILKEKDISWGWGDALNYYLPKIQTLEKENEILKDCFQKGAKYNDKLQKQQAELVELIVDIIDYQDSKTMKQSIEYNLKKIMGVIV